ncbi:hypothetical protein [Saccharothrix deserti]|uniref:hypothetical protein n=1 Tax=Saccharothrix deserti TaxID=2593674 RepID=UPI00131CABDB|nr:hypothetical protein [Saccharothrix deserti]
MIDPVDPVEQTVTDFGRWAEQHGREETDFSAALIALTMLGFEDHADLEPGDLAEFLLDAYPEAMAAFGQAPSEAMPDTLRDLLAFFRDRGRLPADRVRRLLDELDEVEPEFLDLVEDFAGPVPDLASVLGVPDRLPPIRLPSPDVLAADARTARLVADARALAVWVGEQRPTSPDDTELTDADAERAERDLGITSIDRVQLWELADVLGFLDFSEDEPTVSTSADAHAWPDVDDEVALALWERALGHVLLHSAAIDAFAHRAEHLTMAEVGGPLLPLLFLRQGRGMETTGVSDAVRIAADLELEHLSPKAADRVWQAWVAEHGDPGQALLDRLTRLGAVEVRDDVVTLTPVARHVARIKLVEGGIEIPLLPPSAEMTARQLVDAAPGFTEEELAAEVRAWLTSRDAADAARELLDLAAQGDGGERKWAVVVAKQLGGTVAEQWRAALDVPALRAYAKSALGEPPDDSDRAWMLIDAVTSSNGTPEPIAAAVAEVVPAGREQALFEVAWRLPHPQAGDALADIGEAHPDKKIAKAARKAAFKASSRPRA